MVHETAITRQRPAAAPRRRALPAAADAVQQAALRAILRPPEAAEGTRLRRAEAPDAGAADGAGAGAAFTDKSVDEATLLTICAIALAETDPSRTGEQEVKVAWIYRNLWVEHKGEAGFAKSMAYRNADGHGLYAVWRVALGDSAEAGRTNEDGKADVIDRLNADIAARNLKDKLAVKPVKTIGEYVRHLGLERVAKDRAGRIAQAFKSGLNPYPGWTMQGSRQDIDRDTGDWPVVRHYIRRCLADPGLPVLFEVLTAREVRHYTVVADAKTIVARHRRETPKKVAPLSDDELRRAAALVPGGGGAGTDGARATPDAGDVVQPSADGARAATELPPEVEDAIERSRGGGQALQAPLRGRLERAFATDFGAVRLHTDAGADRLARRLGARAFTTRQDVFFRAGEWDPAAPGPLLAHELAHVVQQSARVRRKLAVGASDDAHERAADAAAREVVRILRGEAPAPEAGAGAGLGLSGPALRRQAGGGAGAADAGAADAGTAPPAPAPWPEVRHGREPVARGKTVAQVEQIVGTGQYAQLTDPDVGAAMLLVPVFREFAAGDFQGLRYEPDAGVTSADYEANVKAVRELLVAELNDRTRKLVDKRVAEALAQARKRAADAGVADAGALAEAERQRVESDPALRKAIADQAREEMARDLAGRSAAPLCFFLSSYLYLRAVDRIDAGVGFAAWYRSQLLQGHVGPTAPGSLARGLAFGNARGSRVEVEGGAQYDTLDKVPAGVRLAITRQEHVQGRHFLLVFRDAAGLWRNLDHVYGGGAWHGEPVDPKRVLLVWCIPSMTATAPPRAAPAPAAGPSPAVVVTPEEQRLMQCFERLGWTDLPQSVPESPAAQR